MGDWEKGDFVILYIQFLFGFLCLGMLDMVIFLLSLKTQKSSF